MNAPLPGGLLASQQPPTPTVEARASAQFPDGFWPRFRDGSDVTRAELDRVLIQAILDSSYRRVLRKRICLAEADTR